MSLHCPDKEHLKRSLAYRTGERANIHDQIRDREISEEAMLPFSELVRKRKVELLPNFNYRDIAAHVKAAMRKVKAVLNDTRRFAGCGSIGNGFTMNIPALK